MIEKDGAIRDLLDKPVGTSVEVYGWVRTHRSSKNVHFLQLNDGSCFEPPQVVADLERISDDTLNQATTGSCVRVTGELVASPGKGQSVELQAHDMHVTVLYCRYSGLSAPENLLTIDKTTAKPHPSG